MSPLDGATGAPVDGAGPDRPDPGAALPSPLARALAFVAIVVAGACGALIGYAVTDLQVDGDGGAAAGLGGLVGALIAAGGVAVVAVLTLRSMTEWKTIDERRRHQQRPGASGPR